MLTTGEKSRRDAFVRLNPGEDPREAAPSSAFTPHTQGFRHVV